MEVSNIKNEMITLKLLKENRATAGSFNRFNKTVKQRKYRSMKSHKSVKNLKLRSRKFTRTKNARSGKIYNASLGKFTNKKVTT